MSTRQLRLRASASWTSSQTCVLRSLSATRPLKSTHGDRTGFGGVDLVRQHKVDLIAIMATFGWEKALGDDDELSWWEARVADAAGRQGIPIPA